MVRYFGTIIAAYIVLTLSREFLGVGFLNGVVVGFTLGMVYIIGQNAPRR